MSEKRRFMLFDLSVTGHHSEYIKHLVNFWKSNEVEDELFIIVSPEFMNLYSSIVELEASNIKFKSISIEENRNLTSPESFLGRLSLAFQRWKILNRYADLVKPHSCLLMYLDCFQLPVICGKKFSYPTSGILFRPTFHYNDLINYKPSIRERFLQLREKLFLSKLLEMSNFNNLFCLDPFALEYIISLNQKTRTNLHWIPDPVEIFDTFSDHNYLRDRHKIDLSRKIFLLFGEIHKRKGIFTLLDSIALLKPEQCEKISFLLVGPCRRNVQDEAVIENKIIELAKKLPVQIIRHNKFIPDHEVQHYFQLSDVVLAPYHSHAGMSGVLNRAAIFKKPILASNYGLIGEITRRYKLGITIDSTLPSEIAKGITSFLDVSSSAYVTNLAKNFVDANSVENFSKSIVDKILYT